MYTLAVNAHTVCVFLHKVASFLVTFLYILTNNGCTVLSVNVTWSVKVTLSVWNSIVLARNTVTNLSTSPRAHTHIHSYIVPLPVSLTQYLRTNVDARARRWYTMTWIRVSIRPSLVWHRRLLQTRRMWNQSSIQRRRCTCRTSCPQAC